MPNWVRNCISVEKKYVEKLKEISEIGLARYYMPFPEDLKNTKSPVKIGETISIEDSKALIKTYGYNNWYDWCNHNWGTKWGCCRNHFIDNEYWFDTAWSTIGENILDMLSEDIPDFSFAWEEEQGFGEKWKCENGILTKIEYWELPDWNELLDKLE